MGKIGRIPGNWTEITDIISPQGIKKLHKHELLVFNKEGVLTTLKVTRIVKGRIWAKEVEAYAEDDIMAHEGHQVNFNEEPVFCYTCQMYVGPQITPEQYAAA